MWNLADYMCGASSDAGMDGLGDVLDRVGKAYVRSATAFARYAVNKNGGCSHFKNVCNAGKTGEDVKDYDGNEFLHNQLLAAAESQPHAGHESLRTRADGSIVSMEEIVLRLVGLSVVAHVDRTEGLGNPETNKDDEEKRKNTCFGNPVTDEEKETRGSAYTMCDQLYVAYVTWLRGRPSVDYIGDLQQNNSRSVARRYNEFYDIPLRMHGSKEYESKYECDVGKASANQSFASTDKYLTVSEVQLPGGVTPSSFRQQCLLQHLPSMIDQESLFGLPDFERFPMLKERTGSWLGLGGADHARYDGYMDAYFYDPMGVGKLNATDDPSTDVRRLHLYTIADLAVSMWWALPTLCALTFWALSAAWELPARIEDLLDKKTPLMRTSFPPTLSRVAAWVTSVASVAWIYNVHPWPVVTGPRFDPTCEDYRLWGSVYGISNMEEAAAAWHAATALLFIVLVEVIRGLFLLSMNASFNNGCNAAFRGSEVGDRINLFKKYGVRGTLQLGMVALGVGFLVHVSNLFTRHAANLVFVLQTQDASKLSAIENLQLGARIASSGMMLYSVAFAVTVAAGSVALLWTLPRKESDDGEGDAMTRANGVDFEDWRTLASCASWALLTVLFLGLVPPLEHAAAYDTDLDDTPWHNQFAGYSDTDLSQFKQHFGKENIKGRDDIKDGHADSTFFANDFQGYYSAFVVLFIVTLVAWLVALGLSVCIPPGYRLSKAGQLAERVNNVVGEPPESEESAPYGAHSSVSMIPLLPLAPQPPMRRSQRIHANRGRF